MFQFLATKNAKIILNAIFSIGASIVLLGALGKINHTSWGGMALTAGMVTEITIFFIYAFLPLEKEYHWEKVIPNLDLSNEEEMKSFGKVGSYALNPAGAGNPALDSVEKMLKDAEINPGNMKRLGENFAKLGTTVEQMKDVTHVVSATGEFANKTKEASAAIGNMANAFTQSTQTIQSFNQASEGAKQFHEQVQVLSKNLSSLNTIYELELQESNNHLKALNKFYGNLASASEAMNASVDDAKKAQQQLGVLARNLSNLNQVYGNMLTAMTVRG
jgi:gliding motility-associated protein GldL